MMKALRWMLGIFTALCVQANSAQIFVRNVEVGSASIPIIESNGEPAQGFVMLGTFSADGTTAEVDLSDWIPFADPTVLPNVGGSFIDGFFGFDFAEPLLAGDPRIGRNIYVLGGTGSGLGDSDELFLLRSSVTFPEDSPVGTASILFGDDIANGSLQVVLGNLVEDYEIVVNGNVFGGLTAIQMVPEPSSPALILIAALAICAGRRSRCART